MSKQIKKAEKSLEELLWDSANKLRGTVVSYNYMNVCLGLIFLKYAGGRFDARRAELIEMGREKYIDVPVFLYERECLLPDACVPLVVFDQEREKKRSAAIDRHGFVGNRKE